MNKHLLIFLVLLSMALPIWSATEGKFKYSYPESKDLPYNLGYQYSVYDLEESDIEGWRVMYLNEPVTLNYNITSETDKTVEVIFDPSYLELVDIVIPGKVIDPDTKEEYTVRAIGKMAFDDCPEIRSVIMSDSITRIEDYAFNMCENKVLHKIGYVKFSKNLTHIGNYAFRNCHNLTTGHYVEGDQWPLQAIDFVKNVDYPIYGYGGRQSGLENYLLLPESVDYIGKHAFEGCHFVNIEQEKNKREYGLSKVKIPNTSCVIDDYAFAGCQFLELITLGEELTSAGLKNPSPATAKRGRIGDYAFADCNLMRLDIPSSIESIGENAFINCFHRSRDHTPHTEEGRVYLDNLQWFYPRSLFDNYDSWWANWNIGFSDKDREVKTLKYLDAWHTNTITIHSDQTKIGVNAFANNPLLEKVVINGSVGEIGNAAFKNCSKLKRVTLPDDLRKIPESLFRNCIALDTISIPDNVVEIGDSAFYGCANLVLFELPSNLSKVNPYTFYGCEWLPLEALPENLAAIGEYAFYGCKNITSLNIPGRVKTIGAYAFADCYRHEFIRRNDVPKTYYGLKELTIGDGVESIGAHAFDGCHHLGVIEFGGELTTIGDYAFQNIMSCPEDNCDVECRGVVLPNSLTSMGIGAFQGSTNLPSVTIGDNMTSLPDYAFAYCSDLSEVENISNITTANKTAFIGCYSLEDFGSVFDTGDDLILENGIFFNKELTEVISALPNVTYAELSETNVTKIHEGAFANCGALEYVLFPESLEEIGSRAFENCTGLMSADLVNVKMGEFVYAGCTNIVEVIIHPEFEQDIQDNWFAGCEYMEYIIVDGDNRRYSSYDDQMLLNKEGDTLLRLPSGATELVLPESVTTIGDYSCSNCFRLDYVELPATVTHIGAHAFDGCYKVETYNGFDSYSGLTGIVFENPAITIGEYAFNNCKNLSGILWEGEALPDSVGGIGAYAFSGCEDLLFKTNTLSPAVIRTIEPYAFANFNGLRDIELPATLESIGDHAFENCEDLTSVVFPEGLKRIGKNAFQSTGLKTLTLTDGIEEIGDSAFMNCSQIMELKLPSNLKKINPYTFYKCFSGGQLDEIPQENFNLSIEIPKDVESIGEYAFYGCAVNTNKYIGPSSQTYSNIHRYYLYGLQSVTIGENVKTIGAHAFDGCSHLVEVKMNNVLTSIGEEAFKDCFKQLFNGTRNVEVLLYGNYSKPLDSYPVEWELDPYPPQPILLPESLKSLGEGTFSGCAELPSINYPVFLTDIPARTFNGCEKFSKIELPDGVVSIGDGAFGGCKGVKEISIPASLEKASRAFVDCDSAYNVTYHAEVPRAFDEAFFSPKVYASKEAVANTPNSLLENVKGVTPWALFYKIIAKDDTLVHLERVLEEKNGLRFRVLANKPIPYCEVAGPAVPSDTLISYVVPEYVVNRDPESPYFGQSYKVIRIGNDAFENDMTLVGIEIPSTVFDIGQEAFNGCKNLAEINLPESISNMGERAFANCYALTYFEIPPLVTRLNNEVLKDCRGLNSIKMHENIEELGVGSLMDCRHLRQLEGAENWNLKLIDDYALKNCIELEDVNIPEGVEKIGKEAMYYCQKLNTTSLPTTLLELGENAFDDCEVLHTIKVYTENPPKMIGERHLTDQSCKIYVQAKTLDVYKELWKVHEQRIEPGIIVTQPSRIEMPEYIPGTTTMINSAMPLEGQTRTWSSSNSLVVTPGLAHDGTMNIKGVGPSHIKVLTDQNFYHECDLDVYPQLADANWDARFDISDAVNIANYALENPNVLNNWWKTNRRDLKSESEWMKFYSVGADVNKDNKITIADASATMKEILSMNPAQTAKRHAASVVRNDSTDMDALLIGSVTGTAKGGYNIPVGLMNSREYVAMEANISVPEGMTLEAVKGGARAANHVVSTRRIDDRTMRVVVFDLNNSSFADNNESLLELIVKGSNVKAEDIIITDIVVSDISSNSYSLCTGTGYDPSMIRNVIAGKNVISSTDEGLIIRQAAGKKIIICTLDGMVVKSLVASSDNELVYLDKGIYVVTVDGNSTKITVK